MPLIVDPGLYLLTKSDIFNVNPSRALPTAFKLFTGSCSFINLYSFYLQLSLFFIIYLPEIIIFQGIEDLSFLCVNNYQIL